MLAPVWPQANCGEGLVQRVVTGRGAKEDAQGMPFLWVLQVGLLKGECLSFVLANQLLLCRTRREKNRDGSYGVGVLYVVSFLSRIKPYFSNCSV